MVIASCGKDSNCFKGTGDIVKEQREASNQITKIVTEDNIDIVLTQSNDAQLIVEGGENLLPYIKTEVSGNVLSVFSKNKCGMFRDNTIPITVHLSVPNLTNIDYTGQGKISCTNTLNFSSFEINCNSGTGNIDLSMNVGELTIKQHSGAADFTFRGNADQLFVYTLGQGWFYLNHLVAKNTHVNHSGTGDVFVNVVEELKVELRSRGNVYYTGSSTVEVSPHIGEGVVQHN